MQAHTLYTYSFDELSEAAQHRAWEREYYNFSEDYSSEYRATLEAFEYLFDIKVYNWSVDEWNYTFDFHKAEQAEACPDGDPLRVARYIWNNYADSITRGKYYSIGHYINGKYSYKSRHSNILLEMDNCPLTGTYTDTDILQPVIDCLHYKQFFDNYEDLITTCLDSFFSSWKKAIEYTNSFEYFEELASIFKMLSAWADQAEKLKNGEINKDQYDRWRYTFPAEDTTQIWAKVPSQALSDMLIQALKEEEK